MKPRVLMAEFIGTFSLLFVLFLIANNFIGNPVQWVAIAVGIGVLVVCMATAFGPICGGHFNPCVTFAMIVAKRMDLVTGLAYWIVQCLGAIAGVFTASYLLGPNGEAARTAISVSRGAGIDMLPAIIAEAIAAFLFVTVIFMTAVDKRAPANGALYLGLALTFLILAIGPISGAAINPAVGVALSIGSNKWDNALSWSIGPLLGAGVAAFAYTGLWSKEDA